MIDGERKMVKVVLEIVAILAVVVIIAMCIGYIAWLTKIH